MIEKNWDELFKNDLLELIELAPSGKDIFEAGMEITRLLIEKNISYGDSALNPRPIFSKSSHAESLASRIDDKLNRIANNQSYPGDNDIDDLLGYLILFKIYTNRQSKNLQEVMKKPNVKKTIDKLAVK